MNPEQDEAADHAFEQRARAELRGDLDAPPQELRARLDDVVQRALEAPPRRYALRLGVPAGAVVAVVAGFLVVQHLRPPAAEPSRAADDLALLLNVDNLDLLEQMEFYQWLDRQPDVLDEALAAPAEEAQRS
jgi:hypothetical protein